MLSRSVTLRLLENSPLSPAGTKPSWFYRRRRLIYHKICLVHSHEEYRPCRTTSVDALAWIPNNLICRDLSAISCLLGHVERSSPSLSICDPRVSYSPSARPPLRLPSILASSSPFATGGLVT